MTKRKFTLKDRLSRLTYTRACRLLGPEGAHLIRQGGRLDIDLAENQIYMDDECFILSVNGSDVTISHESGRLDFNCSSCQTACHHAGAAFSLILEEKTLLGLAKPPVKRTPVESLGEEDLVNRALEERRERAGREPMEIKSMEPGELWTDYIVTNALSGKSYRVALRGWDRGDSYCSCPDFRKNTLGTCKHLMKVQEKAGSSFSAAVRKTPFRQEEFAVHILYGKDLQLRLLCPHPVPQEAEEVIRPIKEKNIKDVKKLLECVRRLEASGHSVNIYPDAWEYIEYLLHQDRVGSLVREIHRDPAGHPLRTSLLKEELLPYQLDGIAFAVGTGRAVLADDMGLGKTIQGIGTAELLSRLSGIKKVLIICPASLKSQWRSEICRFSEKDCCLVMGSAAERAVQYNNSCFFTVCNYEQVLRDKSWIEEVKWDLIIVDEGQRIKNWEAKTSQAIKFLKSPFALVLSGTPLENRLDDLFSVVEFIDDRRLGPSFRFFNTYRVVDEKGKLLGYRNLDRLRERLRPVLLRRTRSGVYGQLPERTDKIIRISPSREQFDINQSQKKIIQSIINKPYISEMDLLRLQKALLICRMAADSTFLVDKREPGHSTKIKRLKELLEDLNAQKDRKILLFTEWTTMLDLIEPILKELKMDYVRLDGSVPQKKRAILVNQFQKNPDCRLFMSTNAGSTGLNLQSANTVINVDLPWNPAVLEQRIARAHRMGQKNPINVYILVTENTIEEGMLGTLAAKKEVALASLDINSNIEKVDLASGAEELKNRLEILLGRPEEAPLDIKELEKQRKQAEDAGRREKVAVAAGELFISAFNLLDQVLPPKPDDRIFKQNREIIKTRLKDCLEIDDKGKVEIKLKLPDQSALDNIAEALARFTV